MHASRTSTAAASRTCCTASQADQPLCFVHGGPESQYRCRCNPVVAYLVSRDIAVAAPNVRGSTGYGRDYHHLDDVERRLDSVRDLSELARSLGAVRGGAGRGDGRELPAAT